MPAGLVLEVVDGETDEPIQNAQVKVKHSSDTAWENADPTNSAGLCGIFPYKEEPIDIQLSAESYQTKDTTLVDLSSRGVLIKLYK